MKMIRVDFYHLQRSSLEHILPKLCEKAYSTGKRIKIQLGTEERIEFINTLLWTYSEESFLPHGSKKDGFSEGQPIFISADENNPNAAALLILADNAMPPLDILQQYERVLNIFDGTNDISLDNARNYWKQIRDLNGELHYWQQNEKGGFDQKV